MADPIKMPFGVWTWVVLKNQIPTQECTIFTPKGASPGYVHWSIYSTQLSMGQNWYCADADWDVPHAALCQITWTTPLCYRRWLHWRMTRKRGWNFRVSWMSWRNEPRNWTSDGLTTSAQSGWIPALLGIA